MFYIIQWLIWIIPMIAFSCIAINCFLNKEAARSIHVYTYWDLFVIFLLGVIPVVSMGFLLLVIGIFINDYLEHNYPHFWEVHKD